MMSMQNKYAGHHQSHATRILHFKIQRVCILVIDGIGEWTTTSIWKDMNRLWDIEYPMSLGLFYSAMTDRVDSKQTKMNIFLWVCSMETQIDSMMK